MTSVGAIIFASGVVVWILDFLMHYLLYAGLIPVVAGALSISLPFFGLLFIYLGITPNPPDTTENDSS